MLQAHEIEMKVNLRRLTAGRWNLLREYLLPNHGPLPDNASQKPWQNIRHGMHASKDTHQIQKLTSGYENRGNTELHCI